LGDDGITFAHMRQQEYFRTFALLGGLPACIKNALKLLTFLSSECDSVFFLGHDDSSLKLLVEPSCEQ
jgi:hypothetical protein